MTNRRTVIFLLCILASAALAAAIVISAGANRAAQEPADAVQDEPAKVSFEDELPFMRDPKDGMPDSPAVTASPSAPPEVQEHQAPEHEGVRNDYSFPEDFCTELLPDYYFRKSDEPGRVERVQYQTKDYYSLRYTNKYMEVYLPYGYSEDKCYNVLLLSHGAGKTETFWFSPQYNELGERVCAKDLLDNMIADGLCDGLIVASITVLNDISCTGEKFDQEQFEINSKQFASEIREYILPYLVTHYSTFASDAEEETLIAARDHFAYAGLSWSAMMGYYRIMAEDLPYISSYGLFSSCNIDLSRTLRAFSLEINDYPIRCLYSTGGTEDDWYPYSASMHTETVNTLPELYDGVNAFFVAVEDGEHLIGTWLTGLFNCLLVFFNE